MKNNNKKQEVSKKYSRLYDIYSYNVRTDSFGITGSLQRVELAGREKFCCHKRKVIWHLTIALTGKKYIAGQAIQCQSIGT